jgi:hypothetical protein
MPGKTIGHLKKDGRTKKKQQSDFLQWFAEYASVSKAAKKAKVARSNIYLWMKNDPEFNQLYISACEAALGALEDEAVRRAFEGTIKPVFQQGKQVGKIREYSDTLMIVLLKARAPEKYKERVHQEQTGKDGGPIQAEVTTTVLYLPDNKRNDAAKGD